MTRFPLLAACLCLSACGGETGSHAGSANTASEDPFGATGAPGADLTDNGAADGATGFAVGNGSANGSAAHQ